MKRWRNLLLGILFSVFFLWLTLRGLDWEAVGETLQTLRWVYILPAVVLWSAGLFVRAVRWRVLLGNRVPLTPTTHILNVGFLLNNTLPLRIGELARAYLIGQVPGGISGWTALSTIVTERIVDMLTVVILLVMVLPALAIDQGAVIAGLLMGGVAVVGFVVLLIFAHRPAWATAILNFALRLLPFLKRFKLDALLTRLLDGLQPLTTWRGLLQTALWTAIAWGFSVVGAWVMALMFPDLPQTALMRAALTLSIVAASFSIIIPFTVASVGPFEAATVFALQTVNISPETAVTYAVLWHTFAVVVYAVWGVIGMLGLGLSFSQIQQGAASFGDTAQDGSGG